jgi:hypothetical protein
VLLCIDALCGVTRITREHLAVAVALEVPTALVITKADAADARQLQSLLQQLRQLMAPLLGSQQQQQLQAVQAAPLKKSKLAAAEQDGAEAAAAAAGVLGFEPADPAADPEADAAASQCCDGVPVVATEPLAVQLADALSELHSCTAGAAASFRQVTFPVFTVSCVTGAGLSLLHAFLSRLQPVSTNRSSRQCGAAAAAASPACSSSSVGIRAGAADADVAAAAGLPYSQQRASASSSRSNKQPWMDSHATAAGGAAADVQQQLLDLEGSSSLWVTRQLAAEAAASGSHTGTAAGGGVDVGTAVNAAASVPVLAEAEDAGAAAAAVDAAGHFQVVHTYDVEGVGWVVSGIAVSGEPLIALPPVSCLHSPASSVAIEVDNG